MIIKLYTTDLMPRDTLLKFVNKNLNTKQMKGPVSL